MPIERNVDTIGPEDLARPEIKLIQSTGGETAKSLGAKAGDFFNVMTGEIFNSFEFIFVDSYIQRVFWGRLALGDEPPKCSSLNAKSYISVDGKDCRKCQYLLDNAAMIDATARREKCTKQNSFMGLLLPNLDPFIFRAAGTSSQAVTNLISRFRYNKATWNKETQEIEYHRFKIAALSSEQDTPYGKTYVIHFGEISPLNDPEFEQTLYLTSAAILGQSNNLLSEGQSTGDKIADALADPASKTNQDAESQPPQEEVVAPIINTIPTPKPSGDPVTNVIKKDKPKRKMEI